MAPAVCVVGRAHTNQRFISPDANDAWQTLHGISWQIITENGLGGDEGRGRTPGFPLGPIPGPHSTSGWAVSKRQVCHDALPLLSVIPNSA